MTLPQVAARYRLGTLRGEELPDIAVALLQSGVDSPALRELAGLDRPTLRDAAGCLERVLEERGQVVPDMRRAQLMILDETLDRLASGALHPGDGAYEVWERASHIFPDRELEPWVPFFRLAIRYHWGPELLSAFEDLGPPLPRTAVAEEIVTQARSALGRLRGGSF